MAEHAQPDHASSATFTDAAKVNDAANTNDAAMTDASRPNDAQLPATSPASVPANVEDWWSRAGQVVRRQLDHVQASGVSAVFEGEGSRTYRVTNPKSKLSLTALFDPDARNVRFEYASEAEPPKEVGVVATRQPRGLAPEGGILSLRARPQGIEAFSSDQELSLDDAVRTLLQPVLVPQESVDQAA